MLVADDLLGAGAFVLVAKLAVHPPRDPQQQDAAGEHQADDLQQLVTTSAKTIRSTSAASDADHDDLLALLGGQARGERADDDRIVAGKHDVDEQDLEESRDRRRRDEAARSIA